ncbi:MAG: hypothetical protein HT580_16995 [Dechloromonas sp.]|nr:MAG: hypothetical protein HT580_16995 [Dechloromonas sp.]
MHGNMPTHFVNFSFYQSVFKLYLRFKNYIDAVIWIKFGIRWAGKASCSVRNLGGGGGGEGYAAVHAVAKLTAKDSPITWLNPRESRPSSTCRSARESIESIGTRDGQSLNA